MKIGLIGNGVVGSAVADLVKKKRFPIFIWDKFLSGYTDEKFLKMVLETELLFVCVPTLTNQTTWYQDQRPFWDTMELLKNYSGIIVVKCTLTPGTMTEAKKKYPQIRLVHNPEYLTASNAVKDFEEQKSVILSGNSIDLSVASEIYKTLCPDAEIDMYSSFEATEIIKYFHNCFLSIKVSWCNEMYSICKLSGLNYSTIRDSVANQGGLGWNHTNVPGPDGEMGFGGMCFPKDTSAFLAWAWDKGIDLDTLYGAVTTNKKVRPKYYKDCDRIG